MFVQPNYEFAQSVLQSHQFSFQHLPTVEEINTILNSVEKAYNSKRGTWTPCQDKFLNLLVLGTCLKYKEIPIELTSYQWEQISRMFRYHNWKACRNRWLEECHQKVSWTPAEDQVLIQLQQLHPNKWCEIAIEMMRICKTPYVRQGKQCRDRWVNKLDPNIVTLPWTKEEELKLFREIEKRGKRWAEISLKVFKLKEQKIQLKTDIIIYQNRRKIKLNYAEQLKMKRTKSQSNLLYNNLNNQSIVSFQSKMKKQQIKKINNTISNFLITIKQRSPSNQFALQKKDCQIK